MTLSTTTNVNSCAEDVVKFKLTASPGVEIDEADVDDWIIKNESCYGQNDGIIGFRHQQLLEEFQIQLKS